MRVAIPTLRGCDTSVMRSFGHRTVAPHLSLLLNPKRQLQIDLLLSQTGNPLGFQSSTAE